MKSINVEILCNKPLADNYYLLEFVEPELAKEAKPGQFLQVLVNKSITPFLRRPFSIFDVQEDKISILYKVVGEGTEALKKKNVGEEIGVVGPLGNGFNRSQNFEKALLVAGGIGIAPFVFLARKLKEKNIDVTIFYGVRTSTELIASDYFQDFDLQISTDDGSSCFNGCIGDLLEIYLQDKRLVNSVIFSCGPKAMIKAVAMLAEKYSIPCQLSLEERMACGIGSCLGCVVETKEGYQRVCVEGPVFDSKDLVL